MGDKAICEDMGVKTVVFVYTLAVGVRTAGYYAGMTIGGDSEYMISVTAFFGA